MRRGPPAGGGNPERRFFDAVVRSGELRKPDDAQRFMSALASFDDPFDLLLKLTNDHGPTMLKKCITRAVRQHRDLKLYVLPIFKWLGSDELCGMMCRPQVCEIAKHLLETPGLLHLLKAAYEDGAIGNGVGNRTAAIDEELCLAWFVHLCCKEFSEARKPGHHCHSMALVLIERRLVPEICEELKITLGLDSQLEPNHDEAQRLKQPLHAKTIEDLRAQAGGRHSNDATDFRDVSIMPTVDEIKCDKRPYLPAALSASNSCSAHVERHFRLLREDLLGPARTELQLLQKGQGDQRKRFRYVALESVDVNSSSNQRKAMVVTSFDLADGHKTHSMKQWKERKAYWETYSKGMLQADSLVLLFGPDGSEVFATVVHRDAAELAGSAEEDYRPRIGLRFEAARGAEAAGRMLRFVRHGAVCEMVSITSNYFSYAPVLTVLQKKDKIALSKVILNPADYQPKRPAYLQNLGDVESLFPSSLNPSQSAAMQNTFNSELALVQGPPGTGKTYIEKAIIELIYRHTTEVILLEAYTNHALDQVLEGLLDKGITEIVRIGGRSKSARLQPYNIRDLMDARKAQMPSGFKRRAAILYEKREMAEKEAGNLAWHVNMHAHSASWWNIKDYLREHHRHIFKELNCEHLCGRAVDGFQKASKKGKAVTPTYLWDAWRKGAKRPEWMLDNAPSHDSIWHLSKSKRLQMVQEWLDDLSADTRESLAEQLAYMRDIDEELRTLHKEPMYEILMDKRTRIIGVTSTGASMHADILASVKPGVVIGEEAGELLEAHLLAGTDKSVKHMILIGDHKQLRPKIENHELSVVSGNGHDLNRSLFERLVLAGLRHSALLEQHRMHPDIAAPIMHLEIYPGLTNFPQTQNREKIRGVAGRVCFIDHRQLEQQHHAWKAQTDTSKSNLYEAQLCAYLCRYLLQQGYSRSHITVLTTYLGQVVEINKQLGEVLQIPVDINDRDLKDLVAGGIDVDVTQGDKGQKKGKQSSQQTKAADSSTTTDKIRVSTVDNYQGEENKIVLVSLVRSNAEHQIGFLKEPERLTVMLSRAQCLQIVIGNGECLRNAKNLKGAEWWDKLLKFLEAKGQVAKGLPVQCASHGRTNTLVCKEDFEKIAPNGGCSLECTTLLPCGHRCPLRCHAFDPEHKSVRCKVRVPFVCCKGHKVFGICSDIADLYGDNAAGKANSCDYCDICNEIARIEKKTEQEVARIQAAEQKKLSEQALREANDEMAIQRERALLQEAREKTEHMRAAEKRAVALEKIRRERELEEFCRTDELEQLVQEETEKMEQELAAQEREVAQKNDQLMRKVHELQEQRLQREEGEDRRKQDLNNRLKTVQQRGEERLREAKRHTQVDVEGLAPLFTEVAGVLNLADEASRKKVELVKALLSEGAGDKSARLKLISRALDLELQDPADYGARSKDIQALLDFAGGVVGAGKWIQTLERIDAKLAAPPQDSEQVAELELLRCFATVKILEGSADDAELVKCRDCLKKYGQAAPTVLQSRKHKGVVSNSTCMSGSVLYALLHAAVTDAESKGMPSMTALKSSLKLLLHVGMDTLAGLSDVAVSYSQKHVRVMFPDINGPAVAGGKTALQVQRERRKLHARRSKSLSELESLVGLENVKNLMEQMSARIDLDRERGVDVKKQQMSMRFDGNPGTGKTTVARIYGDFLKEKDVLGKEAQFKETSGAKLISDGVDKLKKLVEEELKEGGVLFVDEAYQLNPKNNPLGGQILDYLLPEMENRRGTLVVIIAGYCKPMDDLMSFNEGLPSRFPERFVFDDYDEKELLQILLNTLQKDGKWKLEDEKHARILARRLAQQAGTTGFGNARAVRNAVDLALKRQAARVLAERQHGSSPDMFLIERADLLGPKGLDIGNCTALKELMGMRGLQAVKQAVQQLTRLVQVNAELEDSEKKVRDVNLNKVFLGNPGTGKTTVAKLYGAILKDMGLLSKGDVIIKSPQDFTGEALGQSEAKTKAILDNARGCVLVVDEAYGLYAGKNVTDPYKTAVVDTIVAEVQGVPGDDRCVLLLGYQNEMEEMMRNTNPGLVRRFNLQDAFRFEDYDDEDLLAILRDKVRQMDMCIDLKVALVAVKVLADQRRTELHFGNGGAVANLLSSAKVRMMTRLKDCNFEQITAASLHSSDFVADEGGQSLESIMADPNSFIETMFSGLLGCDTVKEQVKRLIGTIQFSRRQGRDPLQEIELNFFFAGRPGTGKTTVARIMGRLLKALGLIAKTDVVECSATDLCTGFAGQAGRQTREVFKKALGGVLFIDEAYRLNPEKGGVYMREVLDEMVQILTERDFKNNMAVIIAGYEEDMAMLFKVNPGLKSRIQTTVNFDQFSACDAEKLLKIKLREKELEVRGCLAALCRDLVAAPHWSNGRDIETLAKTIYQKHAASVVSETGRQSMRSAAANDSDRVVDFDLVSSAFSDIIRQKQHADIGYFGESEQDQVLRRLRELQLQTSATATSPVVNTATQQRCEEVLPEAETVAQLEQPEEVANHFAGLDMNFLLSVQRALEELDVDVGDIGQVATFDIQRLAPKFAHCFDLVKEWQRKIKAAWEQAKRMEEELARKKRAQRPRWRCAICGRPHCQVAPYIEGYDDVEL